jgi:hypothetical protein
MHLPETTFRLLLSHLDGTVAVDVHEPDVATVNGEDQRA